MTTIAEVVKLYGGDVRVTCGDRWLVCEDGTFEVYEQRRYRQHGSIRIIATEIESEAVKALTEGT